MEHVSQHSTIASATAAFEADLETAADLRSS
jgi:hypothetical protein